MLKKEGCQVSETANGEAALKTFSRAYVNLVIVDIIMTKKEGFETIRDIMEADAGLKFIFISGSDC